MKYLKRFNESLEKITCSKCKWSWDLKDGGNDPYTCHKCGFDNVIKEGIISKGLEILNYKEVRENDKIAKKYIDMIMSNWNKHKNLMAVKISKNDKYNTLCYKISDDVNAKCGISGGEYPEFIEVELTSINEMGWSNDKTRARISASNKSCPLFGRTMDKNMTLIINDNGIKEAVYNYINISQSQVDNLIKFFEKEYIKKYPQLKNNKYFNYQEIFKVDKELKDNLFKEHSKIRAEKERKYNEMQSKYISLIDENAYYSEEDIKDHFIELSDFINEKNLTDIAVKIGIIENSNLYLKYKFKKIKMLDFISKHEINNLQNLTKSKIIYVLVYEIHIESEEYEDVNGGSPTIEEDIIKFIESDIKLPKNLKILFKGDSNNEDKNPIVSSIINNQLDPEYKFIIIIEQIN